MGSRGPKRRKAHHRLTSPAADSEPLREAADYMAYTPFGIIRAVGYLARGLRRGAGESRERRRWWVMSSRHKHV